MLIRDFVAQLVRSTDGPGHQPEGRALDSELGTDLRQWQALTFHLRSLDYYILLGGIDK